MAVKITFYKFSEKHPEHEQEIIWLQQTGAFNQYGYDFRQVTAYWSWEELDEKGRFNGCSISYDPDNPTEPESLYGCEKVVIVDDCYAEPNDLWISVDDYWRSFDGG